MDLSLSDEQEFLRDAAKGALARLGTVEAAREALEDPSKLPDLSQTVEEAGWNGLLVSEESGGAGLGLFDAMLVMEECGKVLAPVPLLGLVPATYLLDEVANAAYLPTRPPGGHHAGWTVDAPTGFARAAAPTLAADGTLSGTVAWVPDAPGADVLVGVALGEDGAPVAFATEDARVETVTRYDATRSLGHVTLDGATARVIDADPAKLSHAWYIAQALLGAEAMGTVATCLEMAVGYAKERFTFGRAIGSYQAVKHECTEVLRQLENARSLAFYAGWAGESKADELPLAASAFRSTASHALDYATRSNINVHGGIGATWEHDAPLFFRRAQLSRRLLGGAHDATDRVADELLRAAQAAPAA